MRIAKDKRQHVRMGASWPVLWQDSRGMPQQGCVCDIGDGGAFVRPFVGSHIDDFHDGASLVLVFVVGENGRGRSLPVTATARWYGHHSAEGLPGLGVEFDDPRVLATLRSLDRPWLLYELNLRPDNVTSEPTSPFPTHNGETSSRLSASRFVVIES